MTVLILAAGYATRLYPLTLNKPKPLLKVGKKTILARIFEKVNEIPGIKKCFIVTNQKFFDSFNEWKASSAKSETGSGLQIEIVNDRTTTNENRLGAIGDMELVVKNHDIKEGLLVIGGDNLFEFDLKAFYAFAQARGPHASLALFDIKDRKEASRYGVVHIDAKGKVTGFEEKPPKATSTLIATCVYYFPPEVVARMPDYMASGKTMDAPGNYIKWLSENDEVYGFVFTGGWYDIGDLKSLEAADKKYSSK
ncbi:MAG: nucleotidyltransferase family protein [Candidatus Omnitrophica bacterium]|nr:nucleotidyltransferase family protein [Candidatus Omnitrophota bacterium]